MKERTLAILKPDVVENGKCEEILNLIRGKEGMAILRAKRVLLTPAEAAAFYDVHKERSFFGECVRFMSRGYCIVLVIEGDSVVRKWREFMGATDPAMAEEGTLRKRFGSSVGENAVHGSDSLENARREIAFFFAERDLIPYDWNFLKL